eukprot:1159306-Pelagomonas_calceolata.AAC.17
MVMQETGGSGGFLAESISDNAVASTDTTVLLPQAAGPSSMTPVRICRHAHTQEHSDVCEWSMHEAGEGHLIMAHPGSRQRTNKGAECPLGKLKA